MIHAALKRLAASTVGKEGRAFALRARRLVASGYSRLVPGSHVRGLVSVVVPFYNVEKYFDACIRSLRGQSYPWLEIILVDDGSPDGSLEIAKAHARRDPRIRIVRRENGGLSAARNTGLEHARGEYLLFVDSDDVAMRGIIGEAVASLRTSKSQFAVFGYQRIKGSRTHAAAEWIRRAHSRPQQRAAIDERPDIQVNAVAWSKLYRTAFFRDNGFTFPVGKLYEDQPVSAAAYASADAFDILSSVGLNWRVRDDSSSISQQTASVENLVAQIDAGIDSVNIMLEHGHTVAAHERALQVLDVNLMFYASALLISDEEFYDAFRSCLVRLWELTDADERARRLDMKTRVVCALVLDYTRADTLEFLASGRTGFNNNPIVWVEGRPILDMPVRTDPRYSLDPELFVVTPELMNLVGGVKAHWFADGRLHILGWAYIAGTQADSDYPAQEIWLEHSSGERISFDVERVLDTAIDEFTGNEYIDYRTSGFRASVPIERIPKTGTGIVRARATTHGVTSEDALYRRGRPEAGRTAEVRVGTRFLYASAAGGRPFTVASDGGLRSAKLESMRGETVGTVTDARLDDDLLTLTLRPRDRRVDTLALVSGKATIVPLSVERKDGELAATFRLAVTSWGRAGVPAPSGTYNLQLRRGDTPIGGRLWPAESFARIAPLDETSSTHRVRARIRQNGERSHVTVELSAPLQPDERGSRNQVRMRAESIVKPADQEAFFVRSLYGEVANCNPKGIHEEIRRQGLDIPVYWSVADLSVPIPEGGIPVLERSAQWHEKMRTSHYMMVNVHQLPWYVKHDPNQIIIETFHGYPFKTMGHDWWTLADFPATQVAAFDRRARDWTYVLSPATYSTELLNRAFVAPAESTAEFLEIGYPRNDVLQRPEGEAVRQSTRTQLGIAPDAHVVLYAPTFRDYLSDDDMTAEFVAFLDIDELLDTLPSGTVLLMRGHPFNVRSGQVADFSDKVVDVSTYPDVNDLILASDSAILDYSSLRFDYALTGKPAVFFVPDMDVYLENRPGLMPYLETAPGPIARTTAEVAEALSDPERITREYAQTLAEFRSRYADLDDGHAGARLLTILGLGSDAGGPEGTDSVESERPDDGNGEVDSR